MCSEPFVFHILYTYWFTVCWYATQPELRVLTNSLWALILIIPMHSGSPLSLEEYSHGSSPLTNPNNFHKWLSTISCETLQMPGIILKGH